MKTAKITRNLPRVLMIALSFLSGAVSTNVSATQDGFGAHGGNAIEQKFQAFGFQAAKILREWPDVFPGINRDEFDSWVNSTQLTAVPRIQIQNADGQLSDKDYQNNGKANPPWIHISEYQWRKQPPGEYEGIAMALHEYAAVMGKTEEWDRYNESSRFLNLLQSRGIPNSAGGIYQPILLEQNYFNAGDHLGFNTLADAARACQLQKDLNRERYFLVYCVYLKKDWREIHIEKEYYRDYRFLGYVTSFSTNHREYSSASANVSLRKIGWYGGSYTSAHASAHASSGSSSSSTYTHRPLYESVYIPINVLKEYPYSVYGLRVFGVGAITEESPWHTLFKSDHLIDGWESQVFDSRRSAAVACNLALLLYNAKPSFTTYRADCAEEVIPGTDKYRYVVRTKNPFFIGEAGMKMEVAP